MTENGRDENIHATLDALTIPIDQVRPRKGNPRRGDIDAIAESLTRNGQYRPIVVNKATSEILAGNHTYAAARRLGWAHVAVTFVDVDEDQAARIVLADNRTADLGHYDDDLLADLLRSLDGGDLTGTGYDQDDLDALLATPAPADIEIVEPDTTPTEYGVIVRCFTEDEQTAVHEDLSGQYAHVKVITPPLTSAAT